MALISGGSQTKLGPWLQPDDNPAGFILALRMAIAQFRIEMEEPRVVILTAMEAETLSRRSSPGQRNLDGIRLVVADTPSAEAVAGAVRTLADLARSVV